MKMTNWKHWAVGSVAALTIMAGGLWTTESVYAAEPVPADVGEAEASTLQMVRNGRDGRMGNRMDDFGSFGGFGVRAEQGRTLLAEALGISVEELDSAQEQARILAQDAAIAQAVADGELTQEQADAMKQLEGLWGDRGFAGPRIGGPRGFGIAPEFSPRFGVDEHDAYLAEALGISIEELEEAKETALQAGLAEAVAEGDLTQEQADNLLSGLALKGYLSDELDSVLASAIEQAVADGVITQEQADALQDDWQGFGLRGPNGTMRGDFGPGMRGEFPGGRWNDFDHSPRNMFPGGRWNDSETPDAQSSDTLDIMPDSTL